MARDIEWAFADGTLYLLQCRAVTAGSTKDEEPAPVEVTGDPVEALARRTALRRARRATEVAADRAPVQGAPFRRGRDRHPRGLGRRGLLPHRLRRGNGLDPRRGAGELEAGRLLRRDRVDRRGSAHGDDHRLDRPRLSRAHVLGVPPARASTTARSAGSSCSRWRRCSATRSKSPPNPESQLRGDQDVDRCSIHELLDRRAVGKLVVDLAELGPTRRLVQRDGGLVPRHDVEYRHEPEITGFRGRDLQQPASETSATRRRRDHEPGDDAELAGMHSELRSRQPEDSQRRCPMQRDMADDSGCVFDDPCRPLAGDATNPRKSPSETNTG